MLNRFYITDEDYANADTNFVITKDREKIEYSRWCRGDNYPSDEEYRLVYETYVDDFRIEHGRADGIF